MHVNCLAAPYHIGDEMALRERQWRRQLTGGSWAAFLALLADKESRLYDPPAGPVKKAPCPLRHESRVGINGNCSVAGLGVVRILLGWEHGHRTAWIG